MSVELNELDEIDLSSVILIRNLKDLKSLPGYKDAESYLSKRNLDFEKAKVLYRRMRPSADEREFRRKCLAKFGRNGVAILKPGYSMNSEFVDFAALFEVEGEKFNVIALNRSYLKVAVALRCTEVRKNFGKLIDIEERKENDGKESLLSSFDFFDHYPKFFNHLEDEHDDNDYSKICEASEKAVFEVETHYEEPDLRILARIKREKRLGFLAVSELFLGPKSIWVNKNEFPS